MNSNDAKIQKLFNDVEKMLNHVEKLIPERQELITNRSRTFEKNLEQDQDLLEHYSDQLNKTRQEKFLDPLQSSLIADMERISSSRLDFKPNSMPYGGTVAKMATKPWKFSPFTAYPDNHPFYPTNPDENDRYFIESLIKFPNDDRLHDFSELSILNLKGDNTKDILYAINVDKMDPIDAIYLAITANNEKLFDTVLDNYHVDLNKLFSLPTTRTPFLSPLNAKQQLLAAIMKLKNTNLLYYITRLINAGADIVPLYGQPSALDIAIKENLDPRIIQLLSRPFRSLHSPR